LGLGLGLGRRARARSCAMAPLRLWGWSLAEWWACLSYELRPFDVPSKAEVAALLRRVGGALRSLAVSALLLVREGCLLVEAGRRSGVLSPLRLVGGFAWGVGFCLSAAAELASPFIILSALVAIFTVGLTDEEHGTSAYSVFNAGCRRLIGHVGADEMVANMVGGAAGAQMRMQFQGAAGGGAAAAARPGDDDFGDDDDGEDWGDDGDEADDGGGEAPQAAPANGRRNRKKKGRRTAEEKAEIRARRERRDMRAAQEDLAARGLQEWN